MYRRDLYIKKRPESGSNDYSFCTDFFERKDGKLTAYDRFVSCDYEDKYSRHNRYRYYTKVTKFLKKAEYIGKRFRRTKIVKYQNGNIDRSFMDDSISDLIVLFATPDLVLIERRNGFQNKHRYEMLNPRYFNDGNFEFIGEQIPQEKSREDILLEIITQLESDKGKAKAREKSLQLKRK